MSPLDFLFSEETALESISPQPTKILGDGEVPIYGWVSVPRANSVAFAGRPNARMWAFYRLGDRRLEVVSPFGCHHLPVKGLDTSSAIGLVSVQPNGDVAAWKVQLGPEWSDVRGRPQAKTSLKAMGLSDGSFEPLHSSQSFRGIDSKPDFWTVALLPAAPSRIYDKNGCARIEAGGRVFTLPAGQASEDVLSGKVQWGLPDETGFFVLQPRAS